MNFDVPYGITRRLSGTTVERARARVIDALQVEGFGVLTQIDVKATFKKKLSVDVPPYMILGACNPGLARQALDAEPAIGLLLPCNVVVAEDGADAVICAASPKAMFALAQGVKGLQPIVDQAEERLQRAIQRA